MTETKKSILPLTQKIRGMPNYRNEHEAFKNEEIKKRIIFESMEANLRADHDRLCLTPHEGKYLYGDEISNNSAFVGNGYPNRF